MVNHKCSNHIWNCGRPLGFQTFHWIICVILCYVIDAGESQLFHHQWQTCLFSILESRTCLAILNCGGGLDHVTWSWADCLLIHGGLYFCCVCCFWIASRNVCILRCCSLQLSSSSPLTSAPTRGPVWNQNLWLRTSRLLLLFVHGTFWILDLKHLKQDTMILSSSWKYVSICFCFLIWDVFQQVDGNVTFWWRRSVYSFLSSHLHEST